MPRQQDRNYQTPACNAVDAQGLLEAQSMFLLKLAGHENKCKGFSRFSLADTRVDLLEYRREIEKALLGIWIVNN